MEKYKNLIGGKLVDPLSEGYFEDLNPANVRDIIGLFPNSNSRDVQSAAQSALKAFPLWSNVPAPKRVEIMYKAVELIKRNHEQIANVITNETGKSMAEAISEIRSTIEVANFMIAESRRMYGQTIISTFSKRRALTIRIPIGVCGLIASWSAPLELIAAKIFPALICGNTVVLKPSEETPQTAYLLGEILMEAGLHEQEYEGVINIVYGIGSVAGDALVKNQNIDMISFTGTTKVGKIIAEESGRNLKKCSLELGGKNGVIVMDDADLDSAAKAVAEGAFLTAGQRCTSTSRVFVHIAVYDAFMGKLLEETKKMKLGLAFEHDMKIGPVINRPNFNNIMAAIEAAKKAGAKIIQGGNVPKDGKFVSGNFIEPTIITELDPYSKLASEELLGPVLIVFKIGELEEAIEKINVSEYGLVASIYTSSLNNAMLASENIKVGCCYINIPTIGVEPHFPCAGIKNSGYGSRGQGMRAIDVFSEWRTIYLDYNIRNAQLPPKSKL